MSNYNDSDLFDAQLELESKQEELSNAIEDLKKLGADRAKAKREWYIARAVKTAKLRSENYEVTVIRDIASGDRRVSQLEYEYDLLDSSYWAQKAVIQTLRTELNILRENIKIDMGVF